MRVGLLQFLDLRGGGWGLSKKELGDDFEGGGCYLVFY